MVAWGVVYLLGCRYLPDWVWFCSCGSELARESLLIASKLAPTVFSLRLRASALGFVRFQSLEIDGQLGLLDDAAQQRQRHRFLA